MLLFYVRHGDPIYQPDSLTPLGKRQAEAAAKRLATYGIDKIFVSSSTRACQTAAPTAEITKREPVVLDWCNEAYAWNDLTVDDGNGKRTWCFQSQKTVELFNSAEVRNLGEEWYRHPCFAEGRFEEGTKRIRRETDAFLSDLGYVHDRDRCLYRPTRPNAERVALFAHQGFGLAFLSAVLDIPYPLFCSHFDMGHTGITAIEFAAKEGTVIPRVLQLANDSHLYREGIPTCYQNRLYF